MENDNWTQEFAHVNFIKEIPSFVIGAILALTLFSVYYLLTSPVYFLTTVVIPLLIVYFVGKIVKWIFLKFIKNN